MVADEEQGNLDASETPETSMQSHHAENGEIFIFPIRKWSS